MLRTFLTFFLLALCLTVASARAEGGRITGRVVARDTGAPLPGASIELTGPGLTEKRGGLTDTEGRYTIQNVPPGVYTVKVTFIGYLSVTPPNVAVASGASVVVHVQMEVSPLEMQPIIVTAQKREEDLQKVPISISAIDARALQRRGADRFVDLQYSIPNLQVRKLISSQVPVFIRGIGDWSRNIGYEARAAVYVDGVYEGRSVAVNQDLLDIERVEVLRGPQGTLFGKNTVSGAISLTTHKPNGQHQSRFSIEVGSYRLVNTRAILNIPLVENRLFAKLTVKGANRQGFIRNLFNNRDLNGISTFAGRLQVRALASGSLELNLSVNGLRDRSDPSTNALAVAGPAFDLAPDPRQVSHDAGEFRNRDLFGTSLSVDYGAPGGFALRSISSYHASAWEALSEEDYTNVWVSFSNFDEKSRHLTQEVRLTSPPGRKADFVAGLYYFYQKTETTRNWSASERLLRTAFTLSGEAPGNATTRSIAGYVHGNLRLTDRVTLTGGLRYTHDNKRIDYSIRNKPSPIFFIDIDHYRDRYSEGAFSPRGAVNLQVSGNVLIYGSAARGFKSGGWNADFITTLDQFRFNPEFAMSYEAGFKSTTHNNRFRLNAAAYLTKLHDYQVFQFQQPTPDRTFLTLTNAGKVTSKGVEVELQAVPVSGLELSAGLGLTYARYDEFKNGGGPGIHYDGNRLGPPEGVFNFSADYRVDLGLRGRILAHGDLAHRGGQFTNPNNNRRTNYIEPYQLLNARVGYETPAGSWGLFFRVQNLTNRLYQEFKDVSFSGARRAWFGMPREYTVQVTYHFSKSDKQSHASERP